MFIFINVASTAVSRQNIVLIVVKEDWLVVIVQIVPCVVVWRPLIKVFVTISIIYINIGFVTQYFDNSFLICRYLRCRILLMYSVIRLRFLIDGKLSAHLVRIYSIKLLTIFLNNFELA